MFFVLSFYAFKGDFLSPSLISSAVFLLSCICVLINYQKWQIEYHFSTVMVIFVGFCAIFLAELIAKKTAFKTHYSYLHNAKPIRYSPLFLLFFIVISAVALLYFCNYILKLGNSIGINGLMAIGTVKDSTEVSVGGIPLLAFDLCFYSGFVFIYVWCHNTVMCKQKKRRNFLLLLPVLFGLVAVVFRGARGPLLQYVVAFFFLSVLFKSKEIVTLRHRLKVLFKIVLVGLIFSVGFYFLREIVKGRSNGSSFIDYITYYIGSPLYLFDKIVQDPSRVYSGYNYFGSATFTNLYGTLYQLGFVPYNISGLNFTTVMIGDFQLSGNEYTLFMRPYYDFGLIGMSIFVFVLYGTFSFAYHHCLKDNFFKRKYRNLTIVYSMFFYWIVMSFYYCFTAQDVRPQTIVLIALVLFLTHVFSKSRKNQGVIASLKSLRA